MDEQSFDRWARSMAQHPTRRTALRWLSGGLLGGFLFRLRDVPARAHNHCGGCPPGYVCSAGGVCDVEGFPDLDQCTAQGLNDCGGECVDLDDDARNCGSCGFTCGLHQFCAQGICFLEETLDCPAIGLTNCGETHCVDTDSHSIHCGRCDNPCGLGSSCGGGRCLSTGYFCESQGLKECDGGCVDIRTDTQHCGGCNIACYIEGAVCVNGNCR